MMMVLGWVYVSSIGKCYNIKEMGLSCHSHSSHSTLSDYSSVRNVRNGLDFQLTWCFKQRVDFSKKSILANQIT
jgi:hypothetical protein